MTDAAKHSTLWAMNNQVVFSPSIQEIVSAVESAVLDAAQYIVQAGRSGDKLEVNVKADHSLVLNLDIESQRRILAKLGTSFPVVAEEDESSHKLIESCSSYFLVDPLDGTTSCKRFLGQQGGQVGYGPLVGFVKDHQLTVACFYSVPHQRLFTAVRGEGCYASDVDFINGALPAERRRLVAPPCTSLVEAGVLFLLGHHGESRIMQHLKNLNAIENMYRFGGFANDCARLAQGFEQASIQFSVKPWDLPGVLLAIEAGLEAWLDPLNRCVPLREWRIESNNPMYIVHPGIRDELFSKLKTLS
jgi:fructose-1,6-bisphosphatase/inositol monophosphatase family enzyme